MFKKSIIILIIFFLLFIINLLILTAYLTTYSQNNKKDVSEYLNSTVTIFLDDNTKSGSGFIFENGKLVF